MSLSRSTYVTLFFLHVLQLLRLASQTMQQSILQIVTPNARSTPPEPFEIVASAATGTILFFFVVAAGPSRKATTSENTGWHATDE